MPNFKYKVRDKYGRPVNGVIFGENRDAVLSNLKNMGYTPVTIEKMNNPVISKDFLSRFSKPKPDDFIMFTRQLVTLQSVGMPLLMSLSAIREQTESRLLKEVIGSVMSDIEGGQSLSEALEKHPAIFDILYVNMVRAGETAGILDSVLDRLASLKEYEIETYQKVKSATRYPMIVIITFILAFIAVVTFVLPTFAQLFAKFDVALPVPTRILLWINAFCHKYWYILLAMVPLVLFAFKRAVMTKSGAIMYDDFKLRIPIFGQLILKVTMSRFARITSALLKSGIPFLQVLELGSKTAGNLIVSKALDEVRNSVSEGKAMHEAMKANKLFPPIVTQMVAVGESTGKLDDLLMRVADYYDAQVGHALKNLTTAIEPVLIFCLGGMVLVMALAIFLPMWNIISVFKK